MSVNNDNSTDVQFSSACGNFTSSSKSNPCPVCGRTKDGDCRISRDGSLVLCHQNFNHIKTKQPDLWHFNGETSDARCGKYVLKEKTQKSIRPKGIRSWEYPARDGSQLVRVVRIDDGEGEKKFSQERWDKNKRRWLPGLGKDGDANKVVRASIPVYRYAEVRKAIAKDQPIHIVEGEPCADLLWKLGLAATTNIGGGSKFTLTDCLDLQGAKLVVIVPDRDKKGIEHADKLAEFFPEALWLYPFPTSKIWENLPKDHGLDIADWIEHEKLSATELRAVIREKKTFKTPPQELTKVLMHPKVEAPNLSDLATKIDELVDSDLKRSQLQIKISDLAQTYRLASTDVWKIYRTREEELQQEVEQEDTTAEVARLLSVQRAQLDLGEILPAQLVAPIETLAGRLNLKTECYLIALLTQVSSLFKVGSEVLLRRDTDYRCTPNYFGVTVSESSQKKSPVLKAIIDRPMQSLREKARKEYDKAVAQYEEEYRQWKAAKGEDKGLPPKEPRQRLYSFSKSTGEGILYQVAEYPDQALMYRCDELAGLFKSANQYRGGKGSDEEDLLEFWNGTGSTVLRASGIKADLDGLLLSIFGTIQPDVLAALLKDCSDSNGKFARFDFVFQPLAASKLPEEDSGSFDLTPMLSSLYTKIDALPALKMELTPEAKLLFTAFYNATEERRVSESKQGMRAMIGKMPEKVGKMAAIIHTLTCVFNGVEVSLQIPKSAVEAAIKFVKFTADQIASLYAEFSDRQALAPSLAKIVLLAERNGGITSVREVSKFFTSKLRPDNQQIRQWFAELAAMDYGEVTSKGRAISFILRPQPPTPPILSNRYTETVSSAPNGLSLAPPIPPLKTTNGGEWGRNGGEVAPSIKPLPDEALDTNGGVGGEKIQPSQNTQPLMMSCTTEVSPEDAQKLRDIALIWWPQYYPEQLQNLLTQMYGWKAPGTKYDVATIVEWLQGEDDLVRDHITELIHCWRG